MFQRDNSDQVMQIGRNIMKLRTLMVLAVMLFATSAFAQETKVKEKDIPKAVLESFRSAYPNAVVKGYAKEKENGTLFYEIESQDGATRRDLLYKPDGTVAEIEETVAASELPSAAQDVIKAKKATVIRAERVTKDGKITYDVSARQGKKRISFVFDADGNPAKP